MTVQTPHPLINSPTREEVSGWKQLCAWLVLLGAIVTWEFPHWSSADLRAARLQGWLSGIEPDWLPFVPFLLLLPFCWWGFHRQVSVKKRSYNTLLHALGRLLSESPGSENSRPLPACSWAVAVAIVAFLMSQHVGKKFDGIPPAYHDEFSYYFQAETFLSGKWSVPSFEPAPELFDQMHVLNEGKFASRYFPGTGAWIAPFMAIGKPWLGHQIAQAFAAMMLFWVGRELSNSGTGLLAGLLFSFSPGQVLFSNLLLAHHPTLVGLTFFLWAFLRMLRTQSIFMALCSGIGLAFAMLCRPMTAAGFALPMGIVFAWWWLKSGSIFNRSDDDETAAQSILKRSQYITVMGLPILVGFLVIFVQNQSITGHFLKTPYQVYTDLYTPRHVYGFNNVERGEQKLGPKVLEGYDTWAENLNPKLAIENVQTRLLYSWRWTLGVVPLLLTTVLFLLTLKIGDRRWQLIGASIVSLHLAHVPYWFSGIMGWHYVFESAPLWLLLFAEVTRRLFVQWETSGRWAMKYCWLFLIGMSLCVELVTVEPLWPARLDRGISEIKFPRQMYARFRQEVENLRGDSDAIVFVIPDPADVSMDYVSNSPFLDTPVLVARLNDHEKLEEYIMLFPDRLPFLFDASSRSFEVVNRN